MRHVALAIAALLLCASSALAQSRPLPWPDAAPAPELPDQLVQAVMPPVVVALPGMERVTYVRGLAYSASDDPNVRMDVYQPRALKRGERRPAVIFIHGGTDLRGKPKDWGIYQAWGRLAAASGLVGVTFTHHLSFPATHIQQGAADVAAAIAYVRANAETLHVDPDRMCLAAYSAGGPMLSSYMVDAPAGIRCLVGYYPFMDIRQSEAHRASETQQTLERYSDILRVDEPGRKTPLLLLRAGHDEIPTLLDSVDRFIAAALKADYPLTVMNNPGAPHGFDNQTDTPRTHEIVLATLAFLKRYLEEPPVR